MSFPVYPAKVPAYVRDVSFALELLDPASLAPVSDGITVHATGLLGRPILNHGGQFVWLAESAAPQRVLVDSGDLPFEAEDLAPPLPPSRLLQVVLRPMPGYAVPSGVTAVASSLYEHLQPTPQPVTDADVWLQWKDASGGANGPWRDAASKSRNAASGDFVALMRPDASRVPELDATGRVRVRLCFERPGQARVSPDLFLPQGRTTDLAAFAWDQL